MKWIGRFALSALLAAAASPLQGQGSPGQITGVVSEEGGAPVPGATVNVVGTALGAITAQNGSFTIAGVPAGSHQLRVTLLGYAQAEQTVNVAAGQTAEVDIELQQEAVALEGIVAIGYGTQELQDVTGSITSVDTEEIEDQPVGRVDQALAGKVAGVRIQTTNNQPGAGMRIRIRGANSLSGDNDPLVVVDGVLGADLNMINPQDIASIEILKDASATAIYGSRGSNGVILVTTKRGVAGITRIEYSGYYGVQNVSKKLDMLSAAEQAALINLNADSEIRFDDPAALGEGTDWQDVIFQAAPVQNHQLSLTGGSGGTRYLLSGSLFDQEGVIRNSDYQRGSLRLNLDQEISDRFRAGSRISYSRATGSQVRVNDGYGSAGGPVTMTALIFSPIVPVYNEEGNYSGPLLDSQQLDNPLAIINEREDNSTRNYLLGNVFGEYDLLDGVTWRTSGSYTLNEELEQGYTSRLLLSALNEGEASIEDSQRTGWLVENTLNLNRTFADLHEFEAVVGFTAEEIHRRSNETEAVGFTSDELKYNRINLAEEITGGSSSSREALLSYLGRLNYGFAGKYLLTLSGRADGSSKFARNNKWAFFPSAAVAWRISEEPFMQGLTVVSDLKLRASWGKTGSQAISAYQSLASYDIGEDYAYGEQDFHNGALPDRIANPDLRWETTTQFDIGMDLGLFDNLVGLTADYYEKETTDLLYDKAVPFITGFENYTTNVGSLANRGFELSLDAGNNFGAVEWNLGGNIGLNRSEVLDLGGDEMMTLEGVNGSLPRWRPASIIKVGEPLGNFYGYDWVGIYQTEAEVAASGQSGARVGGDRIRDVNGDGEINELDKTIIGNAAPDYSFGLFGSIGYRGVELSVNARGVQGNDIANLVQQALMTPGGAGNQLAAVMDYWTPENPSNEITGIGIDEFDGMTDRWIEDGSFFRVQNITLAYTVPQIFGNRLQVDQLRLFVSAQNPLTLTDYSWYDPEVNSRGGSDLEQGWDDGNYPGTRTLTIGANVSF